jgi:hypothetical protein
VAPEDRDCANATLLAACVKLTPQAWYNQKITSVSHYWAERGVRVYKEDIVGPKRKPERFLTLEQYESVSKMSMRFYIVAKLPLHNLELSIAFSGCPRLG